MNLNKNVSVGIYNALSILVTGVYLILLGYVSYVVLYPSGKDAMGDAFNIFFTFILFIPFSSLFFAIFVSIIPAEPKLQKYLSYGVFSIFLIAYLYIRLIKSYIDLTLGWYDVFILFCGLALLKPANTAAKRSQIKA